MRKSQEPSGTSSPCRRRNRIDDRAQIALTGSQRFLGTFAVFDVGAAGEPLDDRARCIAHRAGAKQEPSIGAVAAPQTRLHLARLAGFQARRASIRAIAADLPGERQTASRSRWPRAQGSPVYSHQRRLKNSARPSGWAVQTMSGSESMTWLSSSSIALDLLADACESPARGSAALFTRHIQRQSSIESTPAGIRRHGVRHDGHFSRRSPGLRLHEGIGRLPCAQRLLSARQHRCGTRLVYRQSGLGTPQSYEEQTYV